eukprot:2670454-Pleurochrysis_carterae.AAC.2
MPLGLRGFGTAPSASAQPPGAPHNGLTCVRPSPSAASSAASRLSPAAAAAVAAVAVASTVPAASAALHALSRGLAARGAL